MIPSYPIVVEKFLDPSTAKYLNDYMVNHTTEDGHQFNSNRRFGMTCFSLDGPFVFGDGSDDHIKCEEIMKDCVNKIHLLMSSHYGVKPNDFRFEHSIYNVMLEGSYLNLHVDQEWDHLGNPQGQDYPDVYSGLLYLNEEYDGGELFFPDINLRLKPKAGDLVYFKGDNSISHEIKTVLDGQRCNVILFFQVDKNTGE